MPAGADTQVHRGFVWDLDAASWRHTQPSLGVSLELVRWSNDIRVPIWPSLAEKSVRQERTAAIVALGIRRPLPLWPGLEAFGRIGAGGLASRLSGTRSQYGLVLSLSAGAIQWLRRGNWGIRFETHYLLARDFNAIIPDATATQNLEFSGTRSPVFAARPLLGPHQDSRFLAVTLGVVWRR
jgi:hypothetical protein